MQRTIGVQILNDRTSFPNLRRKQRQCLRIFSQHDEQSKSTEESANAPKNDILERIAKAQAYKAKRGVSETPVGSSGPSPFGDELERPQESARRLSNEEFRRRLNKGTSFEDSPGFRQGVETNEEVNIEPTFAGSADRRASFLPETVDRIASDMRPAEFALAEEEKRRKRGGEVISVDKSYRPKVSTWGVFPRPSNISETYGGGRTIDPSNPGESKEMSEQRDAEIAAALLKFEKKRGLYVEPEIKKAFQALFDEGVDLMKKGKLLMAAASFEEASKLVDFKTKYAGEAILKRSICLDSLGNTKIAKALYEQLTKHPNNDVKKQAKRMLFGFKAMDHLKVSKMDQSSISKDYIPYFSRLPQQWNSTYMANDSEEIAGFDENLNLALVASGFILLLPLAFILSLALS